MENLKLQGGICTLRVKYGLTKRTIGFKFDMYAWMLLNEITGMLPDNQDVRQHIPTLFWAAHKSYCLSVLNRSEIIKQDKFNRFYNRLRVSDNQALFELFLSSSVGGIKISQLIAEMNPDAEKKK